MNFTLADMVRITGAPRRTIQFWCAEGLLIPDADTRDQGTGVHRRFSRDEAIIACIIYAFARQGLPIGETEKIANVLRIEMNNPFGFDASYARRKRKEIEDAIAGKGDLLITWTQKEHVRALGLDPVASDQKTVTMSLKLLRQPDGFASMILLSQYAKGLS